jgi:hypothetical protein
MKKTQWKMKKWERDIYKKAINGTDMGSDRAIEKLLRTIPADAVLLKYLRDAVIDRGWIRDPADDDAADKARYKAWTKGVKASFQTKIDTLVPLKDLK